MNCSLICQTSLLYESLLFALSFFSFRFLHMGIQVWGLKEKSCKKAPISRLTRDRYFNDFFRYISNSGQFSKTRQFIQHGDTSVYSHCVAVAYVSLWFSYRLRRFPSRACLWALFYMTAPSIPAPVPASEKRAEKKTMQTIGLS